MRRSPTLLVVTALALVAATPASARAATVPNACFWSTHSRWEPQAIHWTGTATPNPLAPGSGATLTGASARTVFPDWVGQAGASTGLLRPGLNELPSTAWIALAADNTAQAVQVLTLETVARTTVTDHGDGTYTATPIDVTVALPDTAWTAAAVGTVGFRQAGPGTLAPVPAGPGGALVTPKGSVFIAASSGTLSMQIDCQPGQPVNDRLDVAPAMAAPFATAAVQAGATQAPAPKAIPAVAVRSSSLKAKGRKVKVALSCTAANCQGALTLKAGSRSLAPRKTYSVRSGAKKTVTLTLSKTAQRSLKDNQSLKVRLRVTATGGKPITKTFTLR